MTPIEEVFEFWRILMGHDRARLGDQRRKKILRALKYGYTVEDLKLAILGCKFSTFHQGQNDRRTVYDDIELICRDEMHIDRFMYLGEQAQRKLISEKTQVTERARSIENKAPMPEGLRSYIRPHLRRVT